MKSDDMIVPCYDIVLFHHRIGCGHPARLYCLYWPLPLPDVFWFSPVWSWVDVVGHNFLTF